MSYVGVVNAQYGKAALQSTVAAVAAADTTAAATAANARVAVVSL